MASIISGVILISGDIVFLGSTPIIYVKSIWNNNPLLFHKFIFIKDLELITDSIENILEKNLLCQVRHLGEKYFCSIKKINKNLFRVDSNELIRAPAQGQSLVIFDDNKCLGGGIITNG